jgi:hypothetical protein
MLFLLQVCTVRDVALLMKALDSAARRGAAGLPPWGAPLAACGRVAAAKPNAMFEYTGGLMGGTVLVSGHHVWHSMMEY